MKNESLPPKLETLFQQLRKAGLDRIPDIKDLMEWTQIDPDDSSIIKLLREAIEEEGTIVQLNPDPFRPTMPHDPREVAGELKLGHLPQNGSPYGISIRQLIHHLLVLGRNGGGKTTLIRHLLRWLVKNHPDIKLLILERKQEYTELLNLSPKPFHVLDIRRLRFNVLKPPPGVPLHMWLSVFTQMMVNYMDIRIASSGFLLEHALYHISNTTDFTPNLKSLYNTIKCVNYPNSSKFARHQESILNRLSTLLNMLPGVFESGNGLDIRDILSSHSLFLLHDIPNLAIQNFVFSLIMAQVFFYRTMVEGHQPALRNLLVLDEAAALFRRKDETRGDVSYLSYMVSQARGYGIGLIAASQFSTDLSHTLLANTGTKIVVGGLGRSEDADLFLRQRPISLEQRNHVMSHPNVGRAFVADSRYPHLLECLIDPPGNIPVPDKATLDRQIKKTVNDLGIATPPPTPSQTQQPKKAPQKEKEEDPFLPILIDIHNTPFQLLRDRAAKVGIKQAALQNMIKKLIEKGLIKDYKVHIPRGSPRELYEITEKGAKTTNLPIKKLKGRGGYLHQFYQMMIRKYLVAQGWKVEIEGLCENKNADLVATKQPDGETIAIEIELNSAADPDHVIHNIVEDLASGRAGKIVCLVPTKTILKKVQKLILDADELKGKQDKIELDCIYNYWEDV